MISIHDIQKLAEPLPKSDLDTVEIKIEIIRFVDEYFPHVNAARRHYAIGQAVIAANNVDMLQGKAIAARIMRGDA